MARRTQKPRKRYVPKPVDHDPVGLAMAHAGLLLPHQRDMLRLPAKAAFDQLRSGHGAWPAWCDVADAMNVAERLCDLNICNDHRATVLAAPAALAGVYWRQHERASWVLRGPEIAALEAGLEIASIQLDYCSQGELGTAIKAVQRCVHQALRGNASPRAMVCHGALGREPGARHVAG